MTSKLICQCLGRLKMNYKIFLPLIFSILLLSGVSAMTVYADFSDGSQTATIDVGESISFNVDFFSTNPPITSMKAGLYSGTNLIHSFLSSNTNEKTYYHTYIYVATLPGTYKIKVIGTDNTNTDSETLALTVNALPTPPNNAPILATIGDKTVNENSPLQFTISATDIDNDALTFSASNLPSGASFNPSLKQFSWTPTFSQSGSYQVTFSVSDNHGGTDSEIITIIVQNVPINNNHVPEIESIHNQNTDEKQEYNYEVVAEDEDAGDTLTYSLTQKPTWLHINEGNGFIYGIAPSVNEDTEYDITVQVSDNHGSIDTQSFTIKVRDTSSINSNTRYLDDDFYNQNRYFDQFNTDKVTVYNPTDKSDNTAISLVIACIAIGIALLILLIAFVVLIFNKEKPQKQQMQSNDRYY